MIFAQCKCCNATVQAEPMAKYLYQLEQRLPIDTNDRKYQSGYKIKNEDGKILWVDVHTFANGFRCTDEIYSDSEKPNN